MSNDETPMSDNNSLVKALTKALADSKAEEAKREKRQAKFAEALMRLYR